MTDWVILTCATVAIAIAIASSMANLQSAIDLNFTPDFSAKFLKVEETE